MGQVGHEKHEVAVRVSFSHNSPHVGSKSGEVSSQKHGDLANQYNTSRYKQLSYTTNIQKNNNIEAVWDTGRVSKMTLQKSLIAVTLTRGVSLSICQDQIKLPQRDQF